MERLTVKVGNDYEIRMSDLSHIVRRFGEYEDLEEQGLLLRIPCELKLGQKWFYAGFKIPIEFEIVDFSWWNTDGLGCAAFGDFPNGSKLSMPFSYFGKYVFKTKEEAEQALLKMKAGD